MTEVVEAIYNFDPQSPEDINLKQGDRIEIVEKLSADWARGKNLSSGQTGVFPLNYVKPAGNDNRSFSRPAAASPPGSGNKKQYDSPQGLDEKSRYQPPEANWQQSQQQYNAPPHYQQQYYPPQQYQQYQPPQQYQQPQQYQYQQQPYPESVMVPQQQQQQPQQQQQHERKHTGFGNVAKRFGDSMVFGAGATLGGDLINKIF